MNNHPLYIARTRAKLALAFSRSYRASVGVRCEGYLLCRRFLCRISFTAYVLELMLLVICKVGIPVMLCKAHMHQRNPTEAIYSGCKHTSACGPCSHLRQVGVSSWARERITARRACRSALACLAYG